ncbi:sensor histidine kinase [Streptomyces sp. TRM66268-LWL]|uniref:Oxygen sensor histidine kinase NreB n=1 Tax=Streptomyces polyasparticus TaxID=2767826 RepID=A0ABR7SJJ3_9ACTN|nr:sensor histidine kinase [Streptomyces polyasparticus]MBC9714656.1 sensor histidine kinase [Streptomyces polyasparticus]
MRPEEADPDARWLTLVMHLTFYVLHLTALIRFIQRHPSSVNTTLVIVLAALLAGIYAAGVGRDTYAPTDPSMRRPQALRVVWLAAVVLVWAVLVELAPSFAWVAVPLIYAALRILPPVAACVLVGVLTVFVTIAQLRLAPRFDLDLVVGPAAVAGFATAVFLHMKRLAARQRRLIDDLIRTRRELAATERRAGTLAERQRLSMEIHDTLAQGLSSQQMLLQAAERTWDRDPAKAHGHVRSATKIVEHNLAEARRFVHDLAPADLAVSGGLPQALRTLAGRESDERLRVLVHAEEPGGPELPERVQSTLLRIAQGALANVREHARATTAVLTLTTLDDRAVLDVADDGRGFDPATLPETPQGSRGHGLPAIRARVRQLGGTLAVESAPGEGTVLTATIPLVGGQASD